MKSTDWELKPKEWVTRQVPALEIVEFAWTGILTIDTKLFLSLVDIDVVTNVLLVYISAMSAEVT